ncbi:hypothetical protein ABE10_03295, partial [Bacillus toyonensis]|nr:hypothetical protein [Bacillus toyonensis]
RWRLGEDEDGEDRQQREHDVGDDRGQIAQRLPQQPSEQTARPAQRLDALLRLRKTAGDMAEARQGHDEQSETDPDPPVVVHGGRMPEEPPGEEQEQHRQDEGGTADERAERVGADPGCDLVVDEEPLVHGAGDGQQHQQEREAVATLILLEGLGAERPEETPHAVREPAPGAHDHRGLLDLVDVLLGRG